jgi:DNA-binding transcriptional MerR regulator
MDQEFRLDELARQAGVATTTVRLYQTKGMLAPPRLDGRTGWYDHSHLRRLKLIARLQEQGFSLAAIASLIDSWECGHGLETVIGVEAELDALLGDAHALLLTPAEAAERLPAEALQPELMQRATSLGLVEATPDGGLRIPDRRFLETGTALAALGVPVDEILDEWEALQTHTDEVARRFVGVFEKHLLPEDWENDLDTVTAADLTESLAQLRMLARQVVGAALDRSLAREGSERLGALLAPTAAVSDS